MFAARLGAQSVRQQFLSQSHHGDYRAGYRNQRSDRRNLITEHVILPVVRPISHDMREAGKPA